MPDILDAAITDTLGTTITCSIPLSGGCIGEVFRLTLVDGRDVVAKVDRSKAPRLDIEGYMLQYLAEHSELPVPEIILSTPEVLLMEHVVGDSHFSPSSEIHAAELLAGLHGIRGQAHGFERPTLNRRTSPTQPLDRLVGCLFSRSSPSLHGGTSPQRRCYAPRTTQAD